MPSLLVEIGFSPKYIEERWRIPIKRRFNFPSKEIKFEKVRGRNRIKAVIVGRRVTENEIIAFCKGYLYGRNLWEKVLQIQLI